MREYIIKIKPLTPIWTGDAERKGTTLRETGIIGSLRWWYEALIRGLGGTACDPTSDNSDNRCPDKRGNHCDACELFGCTGWARKFRLEVEKGNNKIILRFIELRKIEDIEWALLNKTLFIISEYGALGAKLAEPGYGLIEIVNNDLNQFTLQKDEVSNYLKKKGVNVDNPNLKRFIFIQNKLNSHLVRNIKNNLSFLKGTKGKGKRYFYKTLNKAPNRLFLYAGDDGEYNQITDFLKKISIQFVEGKQI